MWKGVKQEYPRCLRDKDRCAEKVISPRHLPATWSSETFSHSFYFNKQMKPSPGPLYPTPVSQHVTMLTP